MSISILKPGVQTTVQDIGRYGYSHFGISSSGAADLFSFRLGNIIVGNAEELAGIEMTLLGADFQFNSDAVIAITGSPFNLSLDRQEIPYNQSIHVKKNQILSVGITKGATSDTIVLPPNNIDLVEKTIKEDKDVAAVILEPTGAGMGFFPIAPSFLHQLRKVTTDNNVILIFDEVVQGFRASRNGTQGRY